MLKRLRIICPFLLPLGLALFISGCDDTKANVTLELKDFSFQHINGLNRFTHIREFHEISGTGLTLNRGKVCVEYNKTCVSAEVSYRINANSTFLQKGHHVATSLEKDTITLEYWGIDDAGNDINIKMSLDIDGQKVTVR